MRLPAVGFQLRLRLLHILDAQRDVVHHSHLPPFGLGGDVEHIFQPTGAVGHLHRAPVGAARLHPAMPVNMEPQSVFVESVFRRPVVNDESGVNHPAGNGIGIGFILRLSFGAFDELDDVAFGILHPEAAASIGPALEGGSAPTLPFSPGSAGAPRRCPS